MKFLLISAFVTVAIATHYAHGKTHYFEKRGRNPGIGSIGKQDSVDFDAVFNTFDTNLITGPIEDMFKSGYQKKKINRANANSKISALLTKTKTKFKDKAPKWDNDHKIAAAGAISTVVGGAGSLVNGIRQGDVMTAISGALGIASAIASIMGPVGSIVGTVLTLISTIFSFFGGSSAEPKESEEAMMKRVVEAALEESKYDELKKEISGVQYLYSTMSSSVADFRRQNEELNEELTLAQGTELYSLVFKELVPFGVLKQYINRYCEAGFIFSDDKRNDKVVDKIKLYAKRCGVLVRLYCTLTIQRQFLLTDMAALLNGDGESKESDAQALRKISKNVVYMLNREQELDHNFLRFLNDPINYPRRRYAVFRLFEEPHKNKLVVAYLAALNKNFPFYPGFYKPPVMACRHVMLQDHCAAIYHQRPVKDLLTSSVFVPHGTKIYSMYLYGDGWRSERAEAEILGVTVVHKITNIYFRMAGEGLDWVKTFSLLIYQDLENDAQAEVSVCGTAALKGRDDPDYCRAFEASNPDKSSFTEHDLKAKLFESVKSVNIPVNRTVTLYDNSDRVVRKFHGPDFIKEVCLPQEWIDAKKVKFEITDNVRQVKVCEGHDLGGKCHNIRLPAHKGSVFFNMKDSNIMGGCTFKIIRSILIPSGMEVQIRYEKSGSGSIGPFVGPITIGDFGVTRERHLDSYKYLKIFDRTEKAIEICQNNDFSGECIIFKESNYAGDDGQFPLSTMKSITVPSGIGVTLYKDRNYRGREVKVTGPDTFWSPSFAFKSFKVKDIAVKKAVELDAVED